MNNKFFKKLPLCLLLFAMIIIASKSNRIFASSSNLTIDASIKKVTIDHANEEIVIKATVPIYYAVIKKADDKTVKADQLIKAGATGPVNSTTSSDGPTITIVPGTQEADFYIDYSAISSSKDIYIGIANRVAADADGTVPLLGAVTVTGSYKKVDFVLNYAAEQSDVYGVKLIKRVTVTYPDGKSVIYQSNPAAGSTNPKDAKSTFKDIKDIQNYIEYKKASGNWQNISTLTRYKWESMLNSGTTIYLRVGAINTGDQTYRPSKEVKVKIAVAKAPNVKADVSKLSFAIKNGMQFRRSGETNWITVLPYDKSSTVTNPVTGPSMSYDPLTDFCNKKISEMSFADVYRYAKIDTNAKSGLVDGYCLPAATVEIRTAPTDKKPASRIATVTLLKQAEKPAAVNITTATGKSAGYSVNSVTWASTDVAEKKDIEFAIVKESSFELINPSSIKWATVKNGGGVIKDSTKTTYNLNDGANSKQTVTIGEPGTVILIRRKGIAANKKSAAQMASAFYVHRYMVN